MDNTEEDKDLHKRRKILSIPFDEVLGNLYALRSVENVIQHKELPPGYIIKCVQHNFERQTFDFLIIHESFEKVLEGVVAPYIDDMYVTVKSYEVKPCQQ
jgi:hypothetical protein